MGGPRDEDGDWRGICLATTIRAGRRDTAAASCLFFHAVFFTPRTYTRTIRRVHRERTPTAASVSMFERAVFAIDIRRSRHSQFRRALFTRLFLSLSLSSPFFFSPVLIYRLSSVIYGLVTLLFESFNPTPLSHCFEIEIALSRNINFTMGV